MSKARLLTEEEKLHIKELYQNDNSILAISKIIKVGTKRVSETLKNLNVKIKTPTDTKNILTTKQIQEFSIPLKTPKNPNNILIAVCKSTGKRFKNVNNTTGGLTSHIVQIDPNVTVPKNPYQTKKFYLENNKTWFDDYFDFIEEEERPKRCCSLCNWETWDVDNKTGCFEVHIHDVHNITIHEYLKQFPDELQHHPNVIKYNKKVKPQNHVKCEVCGGMYSMINDKHLKKHNMSLWEYKLKYPDNKITSEAYSEVLSENYNRHLKHKGLIFRSKAELELEELLKEYNIEVETTNRGLLSGVEIDLFIPKASIGIEYNGLYYHTESKGKDRNYHLNKTKAMNSVGVKLIHIFEDEWIYGKDIVVNKIKHLLNLNNSKKIFARKCKVVDINQKTKNSFLNDNHLQGADKSIISFGLEYEGDVVAVMTFDNKRSMNKGAEEGEYELTRYATDMGCIVVGGASKLLSHFIKTYNPQKIISFGDRRWVLDKDDNMYTKLGFRLTKIVKPDYKYFNSAVSRNKRLHKFGFGKNNLRKKYPNLDFTKTESELTAELGYDKVWDCGLFKYELMV